MRWGRRALACEFMETPAAGKSGGPWPIRGDAREVPSLPIGPHLKEGEVGRGIAAVSAFTRGEAVVCRKRRGRRAALTAFGRDGAICDRCPPRFINQPP